MNNQEQSRAYVNAAGTIKSTILCCITNSKNADMMNVKKNQDFDKKNSKIDVIEENDDEDLEVIIKDLAKDVVINSVSELNHLKGNEEKLDQDEKKKIP